MVILKENKYNKTQNIVWQSSNNNIVSVDTDGKITAKADGEVAVKDYIPDTEYVAVCLVKVGISGGDNTTSSNK